MPERPRCTFIKPDGSSCKARALPGEPFCYFHHPDRAGERARARKKGGKARSKKAAVLPAATSPKGVKTPAAVVKLLSDTIGETQTGAIDPKVANTVGYLANILLRAIETSDLAQRVAELEKRAGG